MKIFLINLLHRLLQKVSAPLWTLTSKWEVMKWMNKDFPNKYMSLMPNALLLENYYKNYVTVYQKLK